MPKSKRLQGEQIKAALIVQHARYSGTMTCAHTQTRTDEHNRSRTEARYEISASPGDVAQQDSPVLAHERARMKTRYDKSEAKTRSEESV